MPRTKQKKAAPKWVSRTVTVTAGWVKTKIDWGMAVETRLRHPSCPAKRVPDAAMPASDFPCAGGLTSTHGGYMLYEHMRHLYFGILSDWGSIPEHMREGARALQSHAIAVVETAAKGDPLMAAALAASLGRDVGDLYNRIRFEHVVREKRCSLNASRSTRKEAWKAVRTAWEESGRTLKPKLAEAVWAEVEGHTYGEGFANEFRKRRKRWMKEPAATAAVDVPAEPKQAEQDAFYQSAINAPEDPALVDFARKCATEYRTRAKRDAKAWGGRSPYTPGA